MTKEARAVAFAGRAFDLDFRNAHPSLLLKYMKSRGEQDKFPVLTVYVEHTDIVREFVAQFYKETLTFAKERLIKLIFGSPPRDDNPLLWALFAEYKSAADLVLADPAFGYLSGLFTDRPYPPATRLSYAIGAMEDAHLCKLADHLTDAFPDGRIIAYMFDGLAFHIDEQRRADLVASLDEFTNAEGLVVTCKAFQAPEA